MDLCGLRNTKSCNTRHLTVAHPYIRLRAMHVPNYVLRARRLNTPPDLPAPPPPRSLRDVERDAWVLDAHVREVRTRSFLRGAATGFVATLAALIVAQHGLPSLQVSVARPGASAQESRKPSVAQVAPTVAPAVAPAPLRAAHVASSVPPQTTLASAASAPAIPMPPPALTQAAAATSVLHNGASSVTGAVVQTQAEPEPRVIIVREVVQPSQRKAEDRRKEEKTKVSGAAHSAQENPQAASPELSAQTMPSVMYSAPAAAAPKQAADTHAGAQATTEASTERHKAAYKPIGWRLVGIPSKEFALIAVSGPGGQEVRPVRVGQELPDGVTLRSIDAKAGQIVTSSGIVPMSH